jgi:plasmid stability protein
MPKSIHIRDLDDDVYAALADRAAELGMTVTQLLRREAEHLAARRSYDEVAAEELRLMRAGAGYRVGDASWSRDSLHDR